MQDQHECEHRFRALMAEYVARVKRLVVHEPEHYVLSTDALRYARSDGPLPEVVWFVDNPGIQEQRNGVFLNEKETGGRTTAGTIAKPVFEAVFGPDYRNRVLILNKSNYSTPKTEDIPDALKAMTQDERQRFKNDMRANAHLAIGIAEAVRCPVIIAGTHKIFTRDFFDVALEGLPDHQAVFNGLKVVPPIQVIPHFSYYKCFLQSDEAEDLNRGWNQRVTRFLDGFGPYAATMTTGSGGISCAAINALRKKDPPAATALLQRFFCEVLLGIAPAAGSGRQATTNRWRPPDSAAATAPRRRSPVKSGPASQRRPSSTRLPRP